MQDYTESLKTAMESEVVKALEEKIEFNKSLKKVKYVEKTDVDSSQLMEILKVFLKEISIEDLKESLVSSKISEEKHSPNNQDNELDTLVGLLKEYTQKKIHNSDVIIMLYSFFVCISTCGFLSAYQYLYKLHIYISIPFQFDIKLPNSLITLLLLCTVVLWFFLLKKLKDSYRNKETIDRNLAKIIRTTSQAGEHVHSGFGKKLELDVRLTEAENALKNSLL